MGLLEGGCGRRLVFNTAISGRVLVINLQSVARIHSGDCLVWS